MFGAGMGQIPAKRHVSENIYHVEPSAPSLSGDIRCGHVTLKTSPVKVIKRIFPNSILINDGVLE